MVDSGCSRKGLISEHMQSDPSYFFTFFSPSSCSELLKIDIALALCLIGTSGAGPQECGFRWGYKCTILNSDSWKGTFACLMQTCPTIFQIGGFHFQHLFTFRLGVEDNSALFQRVWVWLGSLVWGYFGVCFCAEENSSFKTLSAFE